jgi:hypothetical protein
MLGYVNNAPRAAHILASSQRASSAFSISGLTALSSIDIAADALAGVAHLFCPAESPRLY